VEVTSTTPAKIYGLYPKKGAIKEGADADVVVVDLQAEEVIEGDKLYTKAKWSPYEGIKLKGKPLYVISRGEIIYEEGKVLGKPGRGKFLPGPGFANQ
jgi:Dihydroorotase and related cyclic amidohydrolases